MRTERETFWTQYYQQQIEESDSWLDYSNARVQAQTSALALEAAGPVLRRRCLDVGCGKGAFSLGLSALGASEVVGVDIVEDAIEDCRKEYPHVRWVTGSLVDSSLCRDLGSFDLIFLIEVLQYVPIREALSSIWSQVHDGGRIVAVVPNRECPIIGGVVERFEGKYDAPRRSELTSILEELPSVDFWCLRGLFFREDQRLLPYEASTWTGKADWNTPPNRFIFVAQKIGGGGCRE